MKNDTIKLNPSAPWLPGLAIKIYLNFINQHKSLGQTEIDSSLKLHKEDITNKNKKCVLRSDTWIWIWIHRFYSYCKIQSCLCQCFLRQISPLNVKQQYTEEVKNKSHYLWSALSLHFSFSFHLILTKTCTPDCVTFKG